jgi:hypothetical protein
MDAGGSREMNEALLRQFESMGSEAVRQWLDSGDLPTGFQKDAREWLAEKYNQEHAHEAAAATQKINIAHSTADANWEAARSVKRANDIAIAALALGGLAIVISIVALIVHRG